MHGRRIKITQDILAIYVDLRRPINSSLVDECVSRALFTSGFHEDLFNGAGIRMNKGCMHVSPGNRSYRQEGFDQTILMQSKHTVAIATELKSEI